MALIQNPTKLLFNIHIYSYCQIARFRAHCDEDASALGFQFSHQFGRFFTIHSIRQCKWNCGAFLTMLLLPAITCVFTLSFTWRYLCNLWLFLHSFHYLHSNVHSCTFSAASERKYDFVSIVIRSFVAAVASILNMMKKKKINDRICNTFE